MGMGKISDETTKKVLQLQIETGVWQKLFLCEAFYPVTEAAKRLVTAHGDYKPDNVLMGTDGQLIAIDYDLVHAAPACSDFGADDTCPMPPCSLSCLKVVMQRDQLREGEGALHPHRGTCGLS